MTSRALPLSPLWPLLLCLLTSSAAFADGPHPTFGVSPKGKGMANARTATSDGWEAAYDNPAALARLEKGEFSVGLSLVLPQLSLDLDTPLGADHPLSPPDVDPFVGSTWGLAFPFRGFLDDRLYFGFALYLPTLMATHATAFDPARPFFYRYDTYAEHYDVALSLSFKWFDFLATGVGVRIGAGQKGSLSTVVDPLRSRMLYQEIEAVQYSIYAPVAGVTVGPFGIDDIITVRGGFTFREHLSTPMDVPAFLAIDGLDLGLVVPISGQTNYTPRTFSGGLGVDILGMSTLSLDVDYRMWSLAPPPFVHVSVQTSGEDLEALGLDGLLDAPAPGESRVRSPGFVDTVTVRVGGEVRLLQDMWMLRAGYGFRPSPVPDQTSGTNIVDNTAHVLAAGMGLNIDLPFLDENLRIDGAWQTHIMQPRSAQKTDANDPIGNWTAHGFVHEASFQASYFF